MGHGAGCALNGDKNAQTRSAVAAGWDSPRVHQELRDTPVPKTPRVWAAAGCCPAVLLRLSSCQGAVCLALLSSASISFRGQRKGKKRSAWFVWAASCPPCCWGGSRRGPSTQKPPPAPPGTRHLTYRSQFKPQRFSHGSVFCVSTCREAASWGQCEAVPPPGGLVMLRGPLFGEPFGGSPAAGPPRGTFQPLASFRAVNIRHLHGFTQSPRLSLPLGGPGAHPQPLPGK